MLTVAWVTSDQGSWCNFERVDLSGVDVFGVYVIWHEGNPGQIVRIGQGDIASRLSAHRSDLQYLPVPETGNPQGHMGRCTGRSG